MHKSTQNITEKLLRDMQELLSKISVSQINSTEFKDSLILIIQDLTVQLKIIQDQQREELERAYAASLNIMEDLEAEKEKLQKEIALNAENDRKLQQAMNMKSEFISTISHELRTPLASIKGSIDIVMSGSAGAVTEDQNRFLSKAKSNIDRLKRLIDDFLDFSKLESGKVELEQELTDIQRIVDEVIELQKSIATKKGLTLKNEFPINLPQILCDPDRINQVLTNLLNNAIKFTDKGEITVSAKVISDQNSIEICVKDTGEGMREEDVSRIFEKFQQVGDPLKRKTGGTGLGLAICKEIIRQHGGQIWVESQIGEGSRFYFSLPLERKA